MAEEEKLKNRSRSAECDGLAPARVLPDSTSGSEIPTSSLCFIRHDVGFMQHGEADVIKTFH